MIYLFSDKAYEGVVHLPLFEICYDLTPLDTTSFDAFVFTSKKSVQALEEIQAVWKDKEAYAIGIGTASLIRHLGGHLVFTCKDSYGDAFAHQLIPLLQNKSVLFPRAKEVSSSLFTILKDAHIHIKEQVVYETRCKTYPVSKTPPKDSKLIFTSPSTVKCFFKNFNWDESYKAIVIGTKTAAALPLHVKAFIAPEQSIASCLALAKAI